MKCFLSWRSEAGGARLEAGGLTSAPECAGLADWMDNVAPPPWRQLPAGCQRYIVQRSLASHNSIRIAVGAVNKQRIQGEPTKGNDSPAGRRPDPCARRLWPYDPAETFGASSYDRLAYGLANGRNQRPRPA